MICITVNGKKYYREAGQELGLFLREIQGKNARAGSGKGVVFVCGGHGKCGKCAVKASGCLSPVTDDEVRRLGQDKISAGFRLACRLKAEGDCDILTDLVTGFDSGNVAISGISASFELSPAFKKYGVSVDIGTTTLAAKLFGPDGRELASCGARNPQYLWGADVISRMEAALSGEGANLADSVRAAVNDMITGLSGEAGIGAGDIDAAVVTGNTVMLCFFCGIDTEPLTHAPFIAPELFGKSYNASELGINVLSPDAEIYIPPCVSAFIGADIVCASLAAGIDKPGDTEILTDIGTNGEMVLRCEKGLFGCSTAAGPAFEGAGISMGMGGTDGAVDRVRIDHEGGFKVHVIGEEKGAKAKGICGSGIVDAVACMLDAETVDETGFMEDGSCAVCEGVELTQNDIRAVQLAKSAIHAGLLTLMKTSGTREKDVARLSIAGGFGNYLDVESAGKIGLIPPGLVSHVRSVGNAALSGALMLLLSKPRRKEATAFARTVNTVELSTDPFFSQAFMENMTFE